MEKKEIIDIKNIKALMQAKGIDEKELAKRLCITLPTLKRFLGGADQTYLSSSMLYKLSIVLDVKLHSLLHEDYR